MNRLLHMKPRAVWVALVALTAVSVTLAEMHAIGFATVPVIFLSAGVKAFLIMYYFMELPAARSHWAKLYLSWAAVTCVLLAVGCML